MRRTALFACCLAAAVCGLGSGGDAPRWLQIYARARVVYEVPIESGERFDLSFVHSQERTIWVQHYVAGPDSRVWQDGSTFQSYGAGMPIGPAGRSRRGLTAPIDRRMDSVRMLNSRTAQLVLRYRGETLALSQWFESYEPFEIRVR